MTTWEHIVKYLAAIGGCVAGFLGEWNVMLTVLACMMTLDYISGVMVATMTKSSSDGAMRASVQALRSAWVLSVCVLSPSLITRRVRMPVR